MGATLQFLSRRVVEVELQQAVWVAEEGAAVGAAEVQ
jgi:hypothetical protein